MTIVQGALVMRSQDHSQCSSQVIQGDPSERLMTTLTVHEVDLCSSSTYNIQHPCCLSNHVGIGQPFKEKV